MEKLLAGLLTALQEPVIAARDGRVQIWNAPAEGCFPGIFRGMELTQILPEEMTEEGALCCACGMGVIRSADWEGYRIYTVLHEGDSSPVLTAAGAEMRDVLSVMNLACERSGMQNTRDEKQEKYAALMNRGLYRLLRMADHLSLMGEKAPGLQSRVFDFAELLREIVSSVESQTDRRICADTEEEVFFAGDRELLARLCLNLLSNAIKYAPEGEIHLRLRRKQGRVILTVTDCGPGMPTERMAQALQGTAGKTEYSAPAQGTGLGLAVVRRIARLHGGVVVLESREGRGMCVTVSLPEEEMPPILSGGVEPYAARGMNIVLEELSDVLDWKAYRHLYAD